MNRTSTIFRNLFIACAAALTIAGDLLHIPWLVYICKPLSTILILWIAFSNWRSQRDSYSLWITIGLSFSLLGDVAFIRPWTYFVPGLLAFLFAHLAYLVAFTRGAKLFSRPIIVLYLAVAVAFYSFLFPDLPHKLRLPVAFYSPILSLMAAQAMVRFVTLRTSAARRAAIGGISFMVSDFLLSLNLFHSALFAAPAFVLVPYYMAQWLIASSTSE